MCFVSFLTPHSFFFSLFIFFLHLYFFSNHPELLTTNWPCLFCAYTNPPLCLGHTVTPPYSSHLSPVEALDRPHPWLHTAVELRRHQNYLGSYSYKLQYLHCSEGWRHLCILFRGPSFCSYIYYTFCCWLKTSCMSSSLTSMGAPRSKDLSDLPLCSKLRWRQS